MIPIPRIDTKTIIIIVLSVIVFFAFDGCSRVGKLFSGQDTVGTTTTTKTTISVTDRSYRDIQVMPDYFKTTKVKIKITPEGGVSEIPPGDSFPEDDGDTEIVNKYSDSVALPNGTIFYSLITRGELLKTDFKLNTNDTVITT